MVITIGYFFFLLFLYNNSNNNIHGRESYSFFFSNTAHFFPVPVNCGNIAEEYYKIEEEECIPREEKERLFFSSSFIAFPINLTDRIRFIYSYPSAFNSFFFFFLLIHSFSGMTTHHTRNLFFLCMFLPRIKYCGRLDVMRWRKLVGKKVEENLSFWLNYFHPSTEGTS